MFSVNWIQLFLLDFFGLGCWTASSRNRLWKKARLSSEVGSATRNTWIKSRTWTPISDCEKTVQEYQCDSNDVLILWTTPMEKQNTIWDFDYNTLEALLLFYTRCYSAPLKTAESTGFVPFFRNKFRGLFQNFSVTQLDYSRALKVTLTPTLPRSQC